MRVVWRIVALFQVWDVQGGGKVERLSVPRHENVSAHVQLPFAVMNYRRLGCSELTVGD